MLFALWLLACSGERPCERTLTFVGPDGAESVTCARVASRDDERRRGLRGAPALTADEGLWLDYPVAANACITMDGMDQPLDVHFVSEDGRVLRSACGLAPGAEVVCQDGTKGVLERAPTDTCAAYAGSFLYDSPSSAWLAAPDKVLQPCAEQPNASVAGQLFLDVVRHPTVHDAALQRILGSASAWWAERGLWLSLVHEPVEAPIEPVLVGLRRDLSEALAAKGLPESGGTPEEQAAVRAFVVDFVTAPLQEVLRERALPYRKHTVVVVVLPEIGKPGTLAEALFERLRGLTFSPWLRERVGPDEQALYEALDLPERFTPVVFVGNQPLSEVGPEIDVTLAHELGHAMGLPHEDSPRDLMADTVHRCEPGLRADQAQQLMGYRRHESGPPR